MAYQGMIPKRYLWPIGFAVLGGLLGFAYYHFIGCNGGGCPIVGNPYIATGFGILIGGTAGWKPTEENAEAEEGAGDGR